MTALAIILAHLADLLTFVCAASVLPIAGEGNPAARWLFVHGGFAAVIAYKALGVGLILAVVGSMSDAWRTPAIALVVTLGLLGAFANTLAVAWSR